MLRITWTDHASNVEFLRKRETKWSSILNMRKTPWTFIGDILKACSRHIDDRRDRRKIDGKLPNELANMKIRKGSKTLRR